MIERWLLWFYKIYNLQLVKNTRIHSQQETSCENRIEDMKFFYSACHLSDPESKNK
jgi:hypothetical protein